MSKTTRFTKMIALPSMGMRFFSQGSPLPTLISKMASMEQSSSPSLSHFWSRTCAAVVLTGVSSGFISPSLLAVTSTWNGGGSDNNWQTAGNWGGTAPSAGNELTFGGSTRPSNTNNFTAGTAFSGITFASGASAFTLAGTNGIALSGSITNSSSNLQTITIPLTLTSTLTVDTGSAGITLGGTGAGASGVISGAGGLTKNGSGNLTLNAKNTYTGATTINAGTLTFGNTSEGNLSSTTAVTIASGATLALGAYNPSPTHQAGSIAGAGSITSTANASTFTVGADNTSTLFSGSISAGVGQVLTLTKTGTGVLTLSGTNTRVQTQVNGGTVVFQKTSANPTTATAAAAGSIGLGVGGTGDYSDSNVASLFNSTLTGFTLNSASGVAIDTTGGNFTQSTALTAARALTKLGANTLTLTGNNTYSGGTTISAGTVLANNATGSLGTGAINVLTGATVGGTGKIAGATTITSGAILAPGVTAGNLTFSAGLTLNTGAILDFDLGSTSDKIYVTGGTLTGSAGTVTLNIADGIGFGIGPYTLFDFTGASGTSGFDIADFVFGTTNPLYKYSLGFNGNTLELYAVAIPEPTTCAAFAGLLGLGAAMTRRRRRVS